MGGHCWPPACERESTGICFKAFLWVSSAPGFPRFCFKVLSEHTGQLSSRALKLALGVATSGDKIVLFVY